MKIGDLVKLKMAWVSTLGIIIDFEGDFYSGDPEQLRCGRATVSWFNDTQTYESSLALKVLSEF